MLRGKTLLLDWFHRILEKKKEATILVWGSDNAATIDFVEWLRDEELTRKRWIFGKIIIKFKALESAGILIDPTLWRLFYQTIKVDAVVYLADARDHGRLAESKRELDALLSDDSLANVPLLILGSRIDFQTGLNYMKRHVTEHFWRHLFNVIEQEYPESRPEPVPANRFYEMIRNRVVQRDLESRLETIRPRHENTEELLVIVQRGLVRGYVESWPERNQLSLPAVHITKGASEEELKDFLGLADLTTGNGEVNLADANVRPIEVFIYNFPHESGFMDGFKWLSQYIK